MSEVQFSHFFDELLTWSAQPVALDIRHQEHSGETSATRRESLLAKVRSRLTDSGPPCGTGEIPEDDEEPVHCGGDLPGQVTEWVGQ